MRIFIFKGLLVIGLCFSCLQVQAQEISEPSTLVMADRGAYSIIERSNLSRYNNGKYVGHALREVRASIIPKPADKTNSASNGTLLYQGNFFVLGNTIRDVQQSAQVDAVVPVSFQLRGNGTIVIENDQGFPTFRGFPTLPTQKVIPGFRWSAPGNRAVDPLNTGQSVIVPFTAHYEYQGTEVYNTIPVHRIHAEYASQYQNNAGGQNFVRIQGSHKVDILIDANGMIHLMRDNVDETYIWADGSTIQFKGFILTFGKGIVPMDKGSVMASLGTTLGIEQIPDPKPPAALPPPLPPPAPPVSIAGVPENGPSERDDQVALPLPEKPVFNPSGLQDSAIDLIPVPEGIRLTVKDIRFAPDSAEFLPTERSRLDLIAEALKQIPERSFLVEGHTAATGRSAGEMELSIERAKHMVDELVKRGISADRFIYKGWGGTKPLESNSTNAGRARNRRVEITILE